MQKKSKIYREVSKLWVSDASYHKTFRGWKRGYRAMEMALNESQLNPEDIEYVNACISTQVGDIIELKAVKNYFNQQKYVSELK